MVRLVSTLLAVCGAVIKLGNLVLSVFARMFCSSSVIACVFLCVHVHNCQPTRVTLAIEPLVRLVHNACACVHIVGESLRCARSGWSMALWCASNVSCVCGYVRHALVCSVTGTLQLTASSDP